MKWKRQGGIGWGEAEGREFGGWNGRQQFAHVHLGESGEPASVPAPTLHWMPLWANSLKLIAR